MKNGFTLLELSIVLVIIGLIIGGITAGKELIRSSELNSVGSTLQQYDTAMHGFRLKYNSMPGDMDNAEAYWGSGANCGGGDTTGGACNGDGDDFLETGYLEQLGVWQHLTLSELISGSYTGMYDPVVRHAADVNLPSLSANLVASIIAFSNHGYYQVAQMREATGRGGGLTALDTKVIDRKVDDGVAATGRFTTFDSRYGASTCLNSGVYNLTSDNVDCVIRYQIY